jgi:hypothetical protein
MFHTKTAYERSSSTFLEKRTGANIVFSISLTKRCLALDVWICRRLRRCLRDLVALIESQVASIGIELA